MDDEDESKDVTTPKDAADMKELSGWRQVGAGACRKKDPRPEPATLCQEQEQGVVAPPPPPLPLFPPTGQQQQQQQPCRDNLAFLLAAGECDDGWQCNEQCRKLQLQQLVSRRPEQLACIVQDAAWAVTVQNLSPCDYCGMVVSTCGGGARGSSSMDSHGHPEMTTARLLAVIMGKRRFTVRHVLATVRNLHDGNMCMEVLRQTVRLAGDLPKNQAWLEQQLDETEMVHLQSALKRC
jgi:hypothetical protein